MAVLAASVLAASGCRSAPDGLKAKGDRTVAEARGQKDEPVSAPIVGLTSPPRGSVTASDDIVVAGWARGRVAIQHVTVFVNGALMERVAPSAGEFTISFRLKAALESGPNVIEVVASDIAGGTRHAARTVLKGTDMSKGSDMPEAASHLLPFRGRVGSQPILVEYEERLTISGFAGPVDLGRRRTEITTTGMFTTVDETDGVMLQGTVPARLCQTLVARIERLLDEISGGGENIKRVEAEAQSRAPSGLDVTVLEVPGPGVIARRMTNLWVLGMTGPSIRAVTEDKELMSAVAALVAAVRQLR